MASSASRVLVINCGSSSLKFSVLPLQEKMPVFSGLAERLGQQEASMSFVEAQGEKTTLVLDEPSHRCALSLLFSQLTRLNLLGSLCAIGHRVAHGGSEFTHSVLLTPETVDKIRRVSPLAPLHNPANLIGIEAALALLPELPQVAVFDTAFHQTMPPEAYTYAIPLEFQQRYQIRRYGFHGTSHRYIAAEAVAYLQLDPAHHGILIAHLGNGSSVCAVKNGRSVDTSMGMTPLEGLVMGTRCGDLDLGAAAWLAKCTGQSIESLCHLANTQCGLLGLSGLSSDCRTLQAACEKGVPRARLAIEVMVHRLARHLGGHLAALDRLDALIFTGGIGENSVLVRELTVRRLAVFGLRLDEQKNLAIRGGQSGVISAPGSPVIAVIPTNEEKMIAEDAAAIAGGRQATLLPANHF